MAPELPVQRHLCVNAAIFTDQKQVGMIYNPVADLAISPSIWICCLRRNKKNLNSSLLVIKKRYINSFKINICVICNLCNSPKLLCTLYPPKSCFVFFSVKRLEPIRKRTHFIFINTERSISFKWCRTCSSWSQFDMMHYLSHWNRSCTADQ